MSLRALQRQWYAKLKASGFVDLEGPAGDGTLSHRGDLHPVTETSDEYARLADRMKDGADYTAWAESVLHNTKFLSDQERECWRLHASGMPQAEIAPALAIARRSVRRHLARVQSRVSEVSEVKRWRNEKQQRTLQIRALVRKSDPEMLATLVALTLGRAQASRSGS